MPTTTVKIYEVNNAYVSSGTDTPILNIFSMTIVDNDGRLHADEAADPGAPQVITTDAGTVSDYTFIYNDTSTINGQTVTIKTFQLTIDGVTRSFIMEDDWAGLPGVDVGDTLSLTSYTGYSTIPYSSLACFVAGTRVDTPNGPRKIEEIKVGDRVSTVSNGAQPVRWAGSTHLSHRDLLANPDLRPIRIDAGAIEPGVPARALDVSPQHRILISGWAVELSTGLDRALVPAKHLGRASPGAALWKDGVTYCHLMFDRHEIVITEGMHSESLFSGDTVLDGAKGPDAEELKVLFPEAFGGNPARARALAAPQVSRHEAALLV